MEAHDVPEKIHTGQPPRLSCRRRGDDRGTRPGAKHRRKLRRDHTVGKQRHRDKVLKDYRISLGFAPEGHKEVKGDGRTPEGVYRVDRRNPESRFHLSLGISYPNEEDRLRAEEQGIDPGGDIFIHGQEHPRKLVRGDWTWGCIAVTNRQIEDVYAMVGDGTPIQINP